MMDPRMMEGGYIQFRFLQFLICLFIYWLLFVSFKVVPNWLEKEAKNNPMGHFGGQGGRFGAKDIRPQSSFLPSKEKPTEQDEGWDPN